MLFLLEDGGEHSVKEIAAHLVLSLPAASRAVDGLVQRGFVTRRESAEDRRSRIVALSAPAARSWPRCSRARLADPRAVRGRASRPTSGTASSPRCSPSWKGSPASDPTHTPLRGKPPLVDARGDVLRAVHGDARQHGRRTSRCPRSSAASTPRCPRWSGRSTPTSLSFAVLLVTGGRLGDIFGRRKVFLIGVVVFARRLRHDRLRAQRRLARRVARRPGPGRRADDARHALDHHQYVPARRARQARSARGRACRPSPSRSARCSAAG